MDYLIVVPVQMYAIDDNRFACESAFAEHLRLLKNYTSHISSRIHVVCPSMSEETYELVKDSLSIITQKTEGISATFAYPADVGRKSYVTRHLLPTYRLLAKLVSDSSIVHSGPSNSIFYLFEFLSIVIANRKNKPTVFVMDIDERDSAKMDYETGNLSLKSFVLRKLIYDPLVSLQVRYASKKCTLLLLKSKSMVRDYGANRANVKNFLDTVHSPSDVIQDEQLLGKLDDIEHRPFRLIYFGRLTRYKGIKDMIVAVDKAISHNNINLTFTIVGDGEQKDELVSYANSLPSSNAIQFVEGVPYGEELFEIIQAHDALLAAPQRQDTPRNVFDAMSRGLFVIGYDTYYYRDLLDSGAVLVSNWRDIESFTNTITNISTDYSGRKTLSMSAVTFARANSQEFWLEIRRKWLDELLAKKH